MAQLGNEAIGEAIQKNIEVQRTGERGRSSMEELSGRRRFLKSVIARGAVGLPAAEASGQSHGHTHVAQASAAPPPAREPRAYMYLTSPEVAFIDAAVARLIPADELGPGAKEAGVTYFIDQQLFGAYGTMAKQYRQGRWAEGTPQQGYQSRLTPQEIYRAAIRETNLHCARQYGKTFDELAPDQQDQVLRGLDEGTLALASVPARLFFNLLLANTQEGFFADPVYGGNRDKIGWSTATTTNTRCPFGSPTRRRRSPKPSAPRR